MPIRVSVDLVFMAMKGYSTLPKLQGTDLDIVLETYAFTRGKRKEGREKREEKFKYRR